MRSLPAALLATLAIACAPSEQPAADTAAVGAPPAAATSGDAATATAPGATATPLPAPRESAGATSTPAGAGAGAGARRATPRTTGTTPVARGTATDTSTGPRLRPPSKAPGGYIIVPRSAHDSLRMAPPATGTSTRP